MTARKDGEREGGKIHGERQSEMDRGGHGRVR